jgi:hypothetical protein
MHSLVHDNEIAAYLLMSFTTAFAGPPPPEFALSQHRTDWRVQAQSPMQLGGSQMLD